MIICISKVIMHKSTNKILKVIHESQATIIQLYYIIYKIMFKFQKTMIRITKFKCIFFLDNPSATD